MRHLRGHVADVEVFGLGGDRLQAEGARLAAHVRDLAVDVLSHRLLVDARGGGRMSAEDARWILREILERVPVPL